MNRLTHKIAIPLIVFHIVAMFDWVKLMAVPGTGIELSLAHTGIALAAVWYLWMSPKLGALMVVLLLACLPLGAVTPPWLVVSIAVFAWVVQLAGHSVWEKNRPAFVRNMVQALVGPVFFLAVLTGDWGPRTATAK